MLTIRSCSRPAQIVFVIYVKTITSTDIATVVITPKIVALLGIVSTYIISMNTIHGQQAAAFSSFSRLAVRAVFASAFLPTLDLAAIVTIRLDSAFYAHIS